MSFFVQEIFRENSGIVLHKKRNAILQHFHPISCMPCSAGGRSKNLGHISFRLSILVSVLYIGKNVPRIHAVPPPPHTHTLCVEWDFIQTFPGNQDAAVK